MGHEANALAFLAAIAREPHRFDFYQTLRTLECLHPDQPRWGTAVRPADEAIRLGQVPELSFAPAPIAALEAGSPPRLLVRFFGLLGPNGPLPVHLTEHARDRLMHAGDPTFCRFLDLFNHRFMEFFYRAWAQAQPNVSRDRPDADRFAMCVGTLFGGGSEIGPPGQVLPAGADLFYSGILARQVRTADGLAAILGHFFEVPVEIEEHVGQWMPVDDQDRTRLGGLNAGLGTAATLGDRIWDRQHKFRVRIGPLSRVTYERFLPGQDALRQLVAWVRMYLSFELAWDVQLLLQAGEAPPLALGKGPRLGWTTWLGERPSADADDLCLDAEGFLTAGEEAA